MSAYLMSLEDTAIIAEGIVFGPSDDYNPEKPYPSYKLTKTQNEITMQLYALNLTSMKERYPSFDPNSKMEKGPVPNVDQPTLEKMEELVSSWIYQSCEAAVCRDHELFRFCQKLKSLLEERLKQKTAKCNVSNLKERNDNRTLLRPLIEAKNPKGLLYIVAEYRVNESDSMTDYFGHRTKKTVLIGIEGRRCTEKLCRRIVLQHKEFQGMLFYWNRSSGYYGKDYELIQISDPDDTAWEHSTGWHISASKWVPDVDEDWT